MCLRVNWIMDNNRISVVFVSIAGSAIHLFIYFSVSGESLHPNWLLDHLALIGQVHQIPTVLHLLNEKSVKKNNTLIPKQLE